VSCPTTIDIQENGTGAAGSPCAVGHWTLYEYPVVSSTNLIAANFPAWTAVRAERQTGGRGRFQRSWVSDRGGLWLSAVVPITSDKLMRRATPLVAGLAVCNFLSQLGVLGFRLRWPNDVLINNRKLAGVLIDQFVPGLAVVGIGLNVQNRPEESNPALANQTARLVDLLPVVLSMAELTAGLLNHLHQVLIDLNWNGAPTLFQRINKLWTAPRTVELDLDGHRQRGVFTGLDPEGRLALTDAAGTTSFYDAHEVRHLTEV
jgi:BirA family biotin operon repressor/biotin-[acetyl-CoA-carboxylase] ligase